MTVLLIEFFRICAQADTMSFEKGMALHSLIQLWFFESSRRGFLIIGFALL
jgi:hypothetical protein